jgi:hypothetical protein
MRKSERFTFRRIVLGLIFTLLRPGSVFATPASLSMPTGTVVSGSTTDLPVSYSRGTTSQVGLQFVVTKPDGLLFLSTQPGAAATTAGATVSSTPILGQVLLTEDGTSTRLSNGIVAYLHLKAPTSLPIGNYTIQLNSISATDANGVSTALGSTSTTLSVTAPPQCFVSGTVCKVNADCCSNVCAKSGKNLVCK